ncbi:MAG: GIY-YIG nuclease family protein [Sulfurimonas sp.]|nr:GIY-YIG nuclease family protein [Sulfurimonas sp.]
MSNIAKLIGVSENTMSNADGAALCGSELTRVYLMKFEMPDTKEIVWKVGKSSGSSSLNRFMQICRAMYIRYRVMPMAKIKRDRKSDSAYECEAKIHKLLQNHAYMPSKKFDGCTEFFKCEEEFIIDVWESVAIVTN